MLHSYNLAPGAWEIDDNGFLRVKTRVMSAGIMRYTREELGAAVPPELAGETIIHLLVTPDTLAEPRAIRTLEGMPITAGAHAWQKADDNKQTQVGSIAGTPCIEGPYLVADMVVTDSNAVDAVTSRRLAELSAAYDMEIVWEPGEYDGQLYHGRQTRLRYNHTALLPPGKGRAGRDVRVLNHDKLKEEIPMSTGAQSPMTLVSLPGGVRVQVANEDATRVAEAVENAGEQAKKETATAFNEQVTDLSTQMQEAQTALVAAQDRVKELEGQLSEMKAQLDAAMSPQAVEEKAAEMQEEREAATAVMNCDTLPDDMKGLRGHELRVAVVQKVRAQNSAAALSDDELKDEAGIRGRFSAMHEQAQAGGSKRQTVTGASVVTTQAKAQNSAPGNTAQDRLNKLYGAKKA